MQYPSREKCYNVSRIKHFVRFVFFLCKQIRAKQKIIIYQPNLYTTDLHGLTVKPVELIPVNHYFYKRLY